MPLAIAVVVTQVAIMPQVRLFGVVPDLALIAAVAVGWSDGGETGAWFGFVTGLALDLFVSTPFAMTALAYALTAYLASSMHSVIDRRVPVLVAGSVLVAGLCSGMIFVIGSILAGADQLQRTHTIVIVAVAALYDALLALPMFGLVRFVIGESDRVRI